MIARVTSVGVKPGKLDEFRDIYVNSTVPAAKQQKGFVGAMFLANEEGNSSMVISIWESEEDMRAGENSGYYQDQIRSRQHLFDGPTTREYFEVKAQAWAD